jgi:formylglycine-generating enzyme required for sulfatase activity
MLKCLLLILVLNVASFSAQKNTLTPFSRQAILSPVSLNYSLELYKKINIGNAYLARDSLKDYIHLSTVSNKPIDYHTSRPILDINNIWLDTIEIKGYQGEQFIKELYHYTFLNPGKDLLEVSEWELPNSSAYYQNAYKIELDTLYGKLISNEMTNKPIEDYIAPFFMKNYEVSNNEYRQFVYWVRDSIARRLLGEELGYEKWSIETYDSQGNVLDQEDWNLDWEPKINWEKSLENVEQFPVLAQMFLSPNDRFYDRIEIDSRKLMFEYETEDGIRNVLNIYPDTLVWTKGFIDPDMELSTNMYFWHPAYDNYSVVGISYEQAIAFCHWKTRYIRKYFKENGIKFKPTIQLPSIIQWEYASRKQLEKLGSSLKSPFSWETNLLLDEFYSFPQIAEGNTETIRENFQVNWESYPNDTLKMLRRLSGLLSNTTLSECQEPYQFRFFEAHTEALSEEKIKQNDILNIQNLGSNVSEWLLETYQDNWKSQFYKRMELLMTTPGMDATIQALKEEYFNKYNHENGALVIGANWFDFRDEFRKGHTTESQMVKTFPDKTKSFATVGFRYVIVLEEL